MVAFVGIIIGVLIGIVWQINIPVKFAPYISVAIFACIDSIFGAIRAKMTGTFREDIFISGFLGNAAISSVLVYLGDKLSLPIYLAAVIVFGGRILNNFASIRRRLLEKISEKKN
ncbi:Small basic protein [Hathewaya proteolytica DSM 3090]|uniref:Small basic protein n=1 Tax=Hathewaya proteolytica DSM 3090 TaxID=1121331 RepID=A0A1M6L6Y4_9CLOT|nr:small basic family protein [Hathewaya proteolytica]SHJ67018.1 Small basic protein [Hathewaya proteolytica DSM 3090]